MPYRPAPYTTRRTTWPMDRNSKAAAPTKLNSRREQFMGLWFDSRKEAQEAARQEGRRLRGEIKAWEKGKTIYLMVNGTYLYGPKGRRLYYRPDLTITHLDDSTEHLQVKGWKGGDSYARCWLKRQILLANGIHVTEV